MIARSSTSFSKPKRARGGFSLIESMIVVTMVGMMAAAVMPSMIEMLASTRQQSAAVDIMLLARQARREALLGNYAHALLFSSVADNGNGGIQIITGVSGHCNRATLDNIVNPLDVVPPPMGWQSAVGGFRPSAFSRTHRMFLRMEMPAGTVAPTPLRLCYASNGETWVQGPGIFNSEQTLAAILFVLRETGGAEVGMTRQVVFPPGGTARMR